MPIRQAIHRAVAALLGLSLVGCFESTITLRPACGAVGQESSVDVALVDSVPANRVDILLVLDNSGSMSQEQTSLAEQFPRFMEILARGDRDLDGVQDFTPVSDLHVGVVTTDMGVGAFAGIPTCGPGTTAGGAMFGDDGILRTRGNTEIAGCQASYPAVLEFRASEHASDFDEALAEFSANGSCVVQPGTSGCGFEQPLEAALKALTPSTNTAIQFFGPTLGRGDRENAGFLRADSVLVILLMTDEEDCSVDPEKADVFNQASGTYTGDLNLRCFNYPEVALPVQRYIDGFRALRAGEPLRLVFAAVAGVPSSLVADPNSIDYEAILASPEMQEEVRTDGPQAGHQLRPSCIAPAGRGEAFPPRRIVQVARGLGPSSTVGSICQTDLGPVIDQIVQAVTQATPQACLAEPLARTTDGLVNCALEVTLPASEPSAQLCADLPGSIPSLTVRRGNQEQCTLTQLAVSTASGALMPEAGVGWYYDDFTGRIVTTCSDRPSAQGLSLQGTSLPPETTARLRCFNRFEGSTRELPTHGLGAACTSVGAMPCNEAGLPHLFCENTTGTCQLACSESLACPSGLVCDQGASHPDAFCVPPICVAR
ncbi:MAG: hypothetical protein IPK60_09840 [Sandaracinaceae bacterium]|nr:hypothetical protein [Sandaracinaceae bacterium]